MSSFFRDESNTASQAVLADLTPLKPLPNASPFKSHEFANQWLLELGLQGDAKVGVTYQEVKAANKPVEDKRAWVHLRVAVTQGFLTAYQSKPIPGHASFTRCESWVAYPYRNRMSPDFSTLRVNGLALSNSVLTKLQEGVPPDYKGEEPAHTAVVRPPSPLDPREAIRGTLLKRLGTHAADLARLFAGLPTFDTVLKHLLVTSIREKFDPSQFRAPLRQTLDPDSCYVNHFTTDTFGKRSLVSSKSFSDVLWDCLLDNAPPGNTIGGVGFFTRPDSVEDRDSVFVAPLDETTLQAMESAFHIANPTTHYRVRLQFLDDLTAFRTKESLEDSRDASIRITVEQALAFRLSQRFLYLFDLYKADRNPTVQLSQAARIIQYDEDRLLDLILTHPAKASRDRLMNKARMAYVYKVMLDTGGEAQQTWPAAFVIKQIDLDVLFLYSLEGGIQRFDDVHEMVATVSPFYEGQKRKIKHIDLELFEHVFENAAKELLQLQHTALETVLKDPEKAQFDLIAFATATEAALELPMLALEGPLIARGETLLKNARPGAYRTASTFKKMTYRALEHEASKTEEEAARERVQSLLVFTREKIKAYLRSRLHVDIDPDPDKTLITLFQGNACRLKDSRAVSLTQLMLDNLRPAQYPNAMREILPVYLADEDGRPVYHPVTGCLIVLSGPELAQMATHLDIGGRYEIYIGEKLQANDHQKAWWNAYKANMNLRGYEAILKGDEVFKAEVLDGTTPARHEKQVPLWLDAVLKSSSAKERKSVQGRKVNVYGLLLGGSVGAANQQGTLGNATSVDGVLIFSDQDGPDIQGTVGVHFPDSPDGNDFQEFSNLGDGIANLLQVETWRAYFSSRIATNNPEEIKQLLGQRGGRPLIRGSLITGDLGEALYAAHIKFLGAHANHRSNSNREITHQTIVIAVMSAFETLIDVVGALAFFYGFLKVFMFVAKTGRIPIHLSIVKDLLASGVTRNPGAGMTGLSRSGSFFQGMMARLKQQKQPAGLALEPAIYSRYAVADRSVIRGLSPDAGGFYRAAVQDVATGTVTARPVYVRQPDGTVLRVHDHTKVNATEAILVDPDTGLSIRSSGVMRSTVARMPNGEWRAVGFGLGGGGRKRPRSPSPKPGPSRPTVAVPGSPPEADTLSQSIQDMAALVERSGEWANPVMDLVPEFMPNLASWPSNRGLVVIDERPGRDVSMMRFVSGANPAYQLTSAPDLQADVVVRRRGGNHYELLQANHAAPIEMPRDGDCFFSAVALGLNTLEGGNAFSVRGLRVASARYIRQNGQMFSFMETPQPLSGVEPMLENLLGRETLHVLTRGFSEAPAQSGLFQPLRLYLDAAVHASPLAAATQRNRLKRFSDLLPARHRYGLASLREPYTPEQLTAIRVFVGQVLVGDENKEMLNSIFRDPAFTVTRDLVHVMLEYGISIGDLHKFYPKNQRGYVLYDTAVHGQLSARELLDSMGRADFVYPTQLTALADRLRVNTGVHVIDTERLMHLYRYEQSVIRTIGLLRASLRNSPLLLHRAEILLASPVISNNLGGRLRIAVFARWIGQTAISQEKVRAMARYADMRLSELLSTGTIDIRWIHLFDEPNIGRILDSSSEIVNFYRYVTPSSAKAEMPVVLRLLSAAGESPSNSRVAMLLSTPNLFDNLSRNFTPEQARKVWTDLISQNYSDSNIQGTLARADALNSEVDFAASLVIQLMEDVKRAEQIVASIVADPAISANVMANLYRFELTNNRAQHNWLSFVEHVSRSKQIPDWAWQYKKSGN
ncbi:DUF6543 domain-containing protein [Pseudomonas sp. OA65]|uniref:dermonecrotic toxin domain-containing protein n=1 Tax=Pseudomonas sp. OA65 TaxID=2818431 RepID=UPI001A9DA1DB|nr:DUF6543 domain-containing protein [Pseudomonas sp. OA65]MBO1540654.1 hypothetical protein [Pseudomonas sp. OA65]